MSTPPFKLPVREDFLNTSLTDYSPIDNKVNLTYSTDPIHDFVENIVLPSNLTGVVCHSNGEQFFYRIFLGKTFLYKKPLPIEQLIDKISESGKWNDNEIVLLACKSGLNGVLSPAQELADNMCCMVWAPKGVLWVNPNGTFYINDTQITDPNSELLEPEFQKKFWEAFLPITY